MGCELVHGEVKLQVGWGTFAKGIQQAAQIALALRLCGWQKPATAFVAYLELQSAVAAAIPSNLRSKQLPAGLLADHLDTVSGNRTEVKANASTFEATIDNVTLSTAKIRGIHAAALALRLLARHNISIFLKDVGVQG